MSRVGKRVIVLPEGVTVTVASNNVVTVMGPKGQLVKEFHPTLKIKVKDGEVTVDNPAKAKDKQLKMLHGTTNSLIQGMVDGVYKGFEKSLQIIGVGYKAQVEGRKITFSLGLSHKPELIVPEGLEVKSTLPTELLITGIDKQLVGEFAATIKRLRKPEPYGGKGIRYKGEYIRRKAGKAGAK